jgi:hypothetical protein
MRNGLSIFRRNDLIRGLGWPLALASAAVVGFLVRSVFGGDPGWMVAVAVLVLLGLPLMIWSLWGQRCPRCRSNLARHGWAVSPSGGWVRTGDMSRNRYATAAQQCAVCGLDLTVTRPADCPAPAPESERARWIEDYRADRRGRRDGPFFGGS